MSFIAACPDCNKRYNVPHSDKPWHCKVCDCELVIDEDAVGGENPENETCAEGVDCPDCGAPQDAGRHFCGECGADLGGGEQLSEGRKRLERKERGKVLRRAANPIGKLRNILQASAVLLAMFFLVAVLGAYGARGGSESGPMLLISGALGVQLVLLIVVIKQLDRRPLPAVLILSVFQTVFFAIFFGGSLVTALLGDGDLSIVGMVFLCITIFYWSVTVRVAALSKLLKENPDMYAARRMRGETKHLQQRGGEARTRHKARSRSKTPWIAIGSGVAVIALGIGGCMWSEHHSKPKPSPEATSPTAAIAAFQVAWNTSDVEELTKDLQAERQVKWTEIFNRNAKSYSFGPDWPAIVDSSITVQTKNRVTIEFTTERGPLIVKFRWEGHDDWEISAISYVQLNPPDPE